MIEKTCMHGETRQHKYIDHSILNKRESVRVLGKEIVGYKCYSQETKTSLRVCISILSYSVSVWLCVCRGRKPREDKRGRNIFDSEHGSRKGRSYHRTYNPGWPSSTQCVYMRGKNIKDKGALWKRKNWVWLPTTAGFFTFLHFRLITSKFIYKNLDSV